MMCANMVFVELNREAIVATMGLVIPEGVDVAMPVCSKKIECSRAYCEGPTDDGICTSYRPRVGVRDV